MNDLLEKVSLDHFKCTLIEAQLVIMSGFTTSFEPQDNYFLLVYHDTLLLTWQGVQTLDNDEHVVNANPEQQKGHHGVSCRVEEAQGRAQAVADLRIKCVMIIRVTKSRILIEDIWTVSGTELKIQSKMLSLQYESQSGFFACRLCQSSLFCLCQKWFRYPL